MKTKMLKAPTILRTVLFISATLLITGCASKASKQTADISTANQATAEDITRPPSFVQSTTESEAASDPDETVSYDEWQKRREDAAKQAEPESAAVDGLEEINEPEEPTKIH